MWQDDALVTSDSLAHVSIASTLASPIPETENRFSCLSLLTPSLPDTPAVSTPQSSKRVRDESRPSSRPQASRRKTAPGARAEAPASRRSLYRGRNNMSTTPPVVNPSQPNFSLGSPSLPTDPSQPDIEDPAVGGGEAAVVKELLEQVHNTTRDFPTINTLIAQTNRVLSTILAALGLPSRSHNSKLPKIRQIVQFAVTHLQDVYKIFAIPPQSSRNPKQTLAQTILTLNRVRHEFIDISNIQNLDLAGHQDPDSNQWATVNCKSFQLFLKKNSSCSNDWIKLLYTLFSFPTFKQNLLATEQTTQLTKYLANVARCTGVIRVDPPPQQFRTAANFQQLFEQVVGELGQVSHLFTEFTVQTTITCSNNHETVSSDSVSHLTINHVKRFMFRNLVEKFVQNEESDKCNICDLNQISKHKILPLQNALLINFNNQKSYNIQPLEQFKASLLFENTSGVYVLATAFDSHSKPLSVITLNRDNNTYCVSNNVKKSGPKRCSVELGSKTCNTLVYTYLPTPPPAPVLQPPVVFENDDIVVDDTTNWLQISSQDLFNLIETSANNVHTTQAKDELMLRFKNHPSFKFFNIKDSVLILNQKYDWGINSNWSNSRILMEFFQKLKLLSPENFRQELNYCYDSCKKNQLTKEQVAAKVLIHLTQYEIKLLYSKILNALNLNAANRDVQVSVRTQCKNLLIEYFEDPRLSHVLQSEALHRNSRFYALWSNDETINKNQEIIAKIFRDRLESETGEPQHVDGNPIEEKFKEMYNKVSDFKLPDDMCTVCHEKRYGCSITNGMCELCQKSSKRRDTFHPDNMTNLGSVPPVMQGMTYIELLAIKRVCPLVKIVSVGQRPFKKAGNNICFEADIGPVANQLPRLPQDLEIIYFRSNRGGPHLRARRHIIQQALVYLKANNTAYSDVIISEANLQAYPESLDEAVVGIRNLTPEAEGGDVVGPDPGPGFEDGGDDSEDEDDEGGVIPGVDPPLMDSHHVGELQRAGVEAQLVRDQLVNQHRGTEANPLDFPQRGNVANEFDRHFWARAFPHLFAQNMGVFSSHMERRTPLTFHEWLEHCLNWHDGRFTKDPHFLMFCHQTRMKLDAWREGRLYVARSLSHLTHEQLLAILNSNDRSEADGLISQIQRSARKVPGSKAHCRSEGYKGTSMIRFLEALSGGKETFNFFLTLTAKELHDTEFLQSIPAGRLHLQKIVVDNPLLIPANPPPGAEYITKAEDYFQRNRILKEHAIEHSKWFENKVKQFIDLVLKPVFGVREHLCRFEFQSRGGIHAHLLLCLPLGISREERGRAFHPTSPCVEKIQKFVRECLLLNPHSTVLDMMACPGYATLAQELRSPLSAEALGQALEVIELQDKIVRAVYEKWGLTEAHPSNSLDDRYLNNGGHLLAAPSTACLREPYETRIAPDHYRQSLVNLVNKVGTHNCARGNCQRSVVMDGEVHTGCRYHFPRQLVGYEFLNNDTGRPDVVRNDKKIMGEVHSVKSVSGRKYKTILWSRNHLHTYSTSFDLLLGWGGSIELQYCWNNDSVSLYLSKYVSKAETVSEASRNVVYESFKRSAENSVVQFAQTIIRKVYVNRDYPLSEVAFHLANQKLFQYSRTFEFVNVLGDLPLTDNNRGDDEEGENNNGRWGRFRVSQKDWVNQYQTRYDNETFVALCQEWDAAPDHQKPFPKDPTTLSLWDFVAGFKHDWSPRESYVIPHLLPFYSARPSAGGKYLRNFLLSMLIAYHPGSGMSEALHAKSDSELMEMGDTYFEPNAGNVPTFVSDLWFHDETDRLAREAHFEQAEGDMFPAMGTPDEEVVRDGRVGDNDSVGYDEDVPDVATPDNPVDDVDLTDEGYDYDADRLLYVPDWTKESPHLFRASVTPVEQDNLADVVPFDQLNQGQQRVVTYLMTKARAVFGRDHVDGNPDPFRLEVCGVAGAGKTTVMKTFFQSLSLHLEQVGSPYAAADVVRFTAPTGCAAKCLPRPTSTLHSLLNLKLHSTNSKDVEPLSDTALRNVQEKLKHLKVLIIDEKSMISAYRMHEINVRLQQIFADNRPMGGRSVVLMGDFGQLVPVLGRSLVCQPNTVFKGTPKEAEGLKVYKTFTDVLVLGASVRQDNNDSLAEILKSMRVGELSPEQIEQLQDRSEVRADNCAQFAQSTLLCARKADYEQFNRAKLAELNSPRVAVHAVNEPDWAFQASADVAGSLANQLVLCKGMQVMLTTNLNLEVGLTNGSVGTVVGIVYLSRETDRADIPTVLVKFDGYKGDKSVLQDIDNVYPVSAITRTWYTKNTECHRTQLPLVPAYAISIHKSQGLTKETAVLDLGPTEHSGGLTYTALSRVRRLEKLMFRGAIPPSADRLLKYHHSGNRGKLAAHFERVRHDDSTKLAASLATIERYRL